MTTKHWVIVALIANEIRGLLVVGYLVWLHPLGH